ncbi:lipoprotein [Kitasatospora xanthocidica]|uniref:DUF4232 domain-containing protein n=1 Tax=Kitasatospora xanthocidica TaxID=83382 RepID=UPI0016769F9F|nr:DUF4232 domain-containing protein [Kitasatospora xanthocidica]GHF83053.1 lipoprotein [Kitasatospora xanthocidica]
MHQFEKSSRPLTGRRPGAAAAAVAAVLLTGCGSQVTGAGGTLAPSGSAGPCGVALPSPTAGAQVPSALARDGVRITAVNAACAEYEVTNRGTEPSDVTVQFGLFSPAGAVKDYVTETVAAVAPGATVKQRLDLNGTTPTAGPGSGAAFPPIEPVQPTRPGTGPAAPGAAPQLKITKVRSVPTAEAPRPDGPCPASGLRLYADEGDAAMGLRVLGLHLRNCGTATVDLDGYPTLQLLDLEHRPVDGVRLLSGGAEIATGTGADNPPQKIALRPGEGARATLVWRNTTLDGAPENVPYVRVRATPDAAPVTVTPELDLGTTGRLGIGAWARESGDPRPASRPS